MKFIDHKTLAVFWARNCGAEMSLINRCAFVFGNIQPDMNVLTFLHGFRKHQKFHGHNFNNVLPVLLRLVESRGKSPLAVCNYYRLGKCLHYTADIFTFAHNESFTGDISEHRRYEFALHDRLTERLDEFTPQMSPLTTSAEMLKRTLVAMHDRYLADGPGCARDCGYILGATRMLVEASLQPEKKVMPYANFAYNRLVSSRN